MLIHPSVRFPFGFPGPTYWVWHFRHVTRYTTLGVRQEILHPILALKAFSRIEECTFVLLSRYLQYFQVIVGQLVCLRGVTSFSALSGA